MMNVLHILSDQHQAACTGYENHPQAITPNLDKLAQSGIWFRNAYTQNPICTPSRVSILSGQYCHNHGYYGLSGPRPQRLPSMLGHLRAHGYRTAGIGKLHLPDSPNDWIIDDVDLYAECYEEGNNGYRSPYFAYLEALGMRDKEESLTLPEFPGRQQHEARPAVLPYLHSTEGWCVQTTKRFIIESGEGPWCAQVSFPRPHQCYTPDRKFWAMYPEDLELPFGLHADAGHRAPHFQRMVNLYRNGRGLLQPDDFESWARRVWRGYLACITQVDYAVGELLDFLDEAGQSDNTIVIYGSDHGAYSGTFGIPEKAPGICSEQVCRVPMIWRVPGVTRAGLQNSQLVENVDIAPTVVALCAAPPMETCDGLDLSPLLRGVNSAVHEIAVTENVWSKALRFGKWRFVHYQRETFEDDAGELYDLEADPQETRNLYHVAEYSGVVNDCRRLLLEWLIRTTRVRTVWPPPASDEKLSVTSHPYATVGDGKLSNTYGPHANAQPRGWNYL